MPLDSAFLARHCRTDRPPMQAPVGACGTSIRASGHQHVIPFAPGQRAPRGPRDHAQPLSRPPHRRRLHARIRRAEPMQARADTDVTPLPMALAPPLAPDFVPGRRPAGGGLPLGCHRGRKGWPSAVRGTEAGFDRPFPKAQRRGHTTRWVLRCYPSARPTCLVKACLQAHDQLASPPINRFSLRPR